MIEIDHGNGLATRYGHLSAIDVTEGQMIRIGQVVGKVGSTGRSTGPHLHYETRVDGDAVDPQKFPARRHPAGRVLRRRALAAARRPILASIRTDHASIEAKALAATKAPKSARSGPHIAAPCPRTNRRTQACPSARERAGGRKSPRRPRRS